ncbi:uncharacterized protein LOC128265450 [Drosophila gunungcola]|uniref:uncharacterized protein LOC128265450 n=1 Tax=Drosophila gunungcola TaxID=103775 RepID=UPI0022E0A757|nr:uncharacterized protein LOC128265450 [Drosophila gunungcola]
MASEDLAAQEASEDLAAQEASEVLADLAAKKASMAASAVLVDGVHVLIDQVARDLGSPPRRAVWLKAPQLAPIVPPATAAPLTAAPLTAAPLTAAPLTAAPLIAALLIAALLIAAPLIVAQPRAPPVRNRFNDSPAEY